MTGSDWPKGTRTESFGFLVQALSKRIDERMKANLADLGLNFRFFMSLMLLLAEDGRSQRDLGSGLGLPEYQVSRNLDAMEKDGLVERRPCPTSRRTTLIYLTGKGRDLAQKLPPLIHAQNQDTLSALDSDECMTLIGLLQKVHASTG